MVIFKMLMFTASPICDLLQIESMKRMGACGGVSNSNIAKQQKENGNRSKEEKPNPAKVFEINSDTSVIMDVNVANMNGQKCSFTWPGAIVMARYFSANPEIVRGKRLVELGCGTGLPSIVALKLAAEHATLTDLNISYAQKSLKLNNICSTKYRCMVCHWGLISPYLREIDALDLIIAADCFYESYQFESVIKTVAFLMEFNSDAVFIFTVPIRDGLKSISWILKEYNIRGHLIERNFDDSGCEFLICQAKKIDY
ncbi:histone-arginine methyltransferase METTL23-like [Convolutriloba macropyga]|uniref:histone-arginine methyltransferase METTL23-like n=1 Tax=Convolutriloba macropyga TaxID=536237 RepID=UPI003F520877